MFQGLLGIIPPVLWVAMGGAGGAVLRWSTYLGFQRMGFNAPWATLSVNIAGSLAIGYFFGAGADKGPMGETWRLLVTVGFIGALTTFSAFSKESLHMLQHSQWGFLLLNVLANNLLSIAAAWAGYRMAAAW